VDSDPDSADPGRDTGSNGASDPNFDPDFDPEATGETTPGAAPRSPDACPDDLPKACDRIWSYMERLGVEPCERGQITLDLLDHAMESTLAEGGHLTPAAMDALTAWLARREAALADAPAPCDDAALIGQLAHPPVQRQCMAPEPRRDRAAWRRMRQSAQTRAKALVAPPPSNPSP
jgi:hypothetical protein